MKVTELTSRDNSLFRLVRLAATQGRRAPRDLVLAEGIRSVEEAAAARFAVEAVVYSTDFGATVRESALLTALSARGAKVYRTSARLLKSVSEVQTPQGILGLVRVPVVTLGGLPRVPQALILCACGLQDPGNLGTLIRAAAAAGASLVCTTTGTVSARNPKTVRASAGAFFRIPVAEHLALPELLAHCRSNSITVYSMDVRGATSYTDADYRPACAILLGNEGQGLEISARAGMAGIRIPMAAGVESLNVGVAGSLVLFEAFRQRGGVALTESETPAAHGRGHRT